MLGKLAKVDGLPDTQLSWYDKYQKGRVANGEKEKAVYQRIQGKSH